MSRSKLSDRRCDEIKEEVLFLYEECDVHTYPIDCLGIARKLYYVLRPYSSLSPDYLLKASTISTDGYSLVEVNQSTGMNQYVIYYNDLSGNRGRMRWTVFHEIGHIYLGHHDNEDDSLSDIEEAEADFFAKYAIANPPLVNISHCERPEDIETKFDTSREASLNLYEYYMKWKNFGPRDYLPFEEKIIERFDAYKSISSVEYCF